MTVKRFAIACMALLLTSGCGGDKVEKGRRLIDSAPEKAIALFLEAEQEKGECFDCLIYLGLVYEKTGRLEEAVSTYEKALTMKEAASRPEPVSERLLTLYEKQHDSATAPEVRLTTAKKAAAIEKTLKVASPWANTYLFDLCTKDMKTAAENGNEKGVRTAAEICNALMVPADRKNNFASEATNTLQNAFVKRIGSKFAEDLAEVLAERGIYNKKKDTITFKNEFVIPDGKVSPDFKADSPDFTSNVRKGACIPLHKMIVETIKLAEPLLDLKSVDKTNLDLAFQDFYKIARAGFSSPIGDARSPAGLPYMCIIEMPLNEFLSSLFRFAE
jgi:tetratricopeptide (TPR) repeat protein